MTLMLNKNSQPCACYHWWGHQNEPPAYSNLRTPIILSIATLRAVSDIPIVIFDISEQENDWAHFSDKLNFKVIKTDCQLKKYNKLIEGWPYLSRLFDLRASFIRPNADKDVLMYVDSDVFWLQNPLPLMKSTDKFCFDGWNSGFFYFDFHSPTIEQFFQIFEAYTKAAIYSEDIRKVMKRYLSYDGWYGVWDEMILTYMTHQHRELFDIIPVEEHSTTRVIQYADKSRLKMFHCNGTMVSNPTAKCKGEEQHSRGLICLLVSEFYQNILKVLDHHDLKMIFTEVEMEHCLQKQFSLLDNIAALLATKDECGHYHAQRIFS